MMDCDKYLKQEVQQRLTDIVREALVSERSAMLNRMQWNAAKHRRHPMGIDEWRIQIALVMEITNSIAECEEEMKRIYGL